KGQVSIDGDKYVEVCRREGEQLAILERRPPICRAVFTSWDASSRPSRQSTHSSSNTLTRQFRSVGPSLPQGKRSLDRALQTGILRESRRLCRRLRCNRAGSAQELLCHRTLRCRPSPRGYSKQLAASC